MNIALGTNLDNINSLFRQNEIPEHAICAIFIKYWALNLSLNCENDQKIKNINILTADLKLNKYVL